MNQLLGWAREHGYTVKMLTMTARHGHADRLADLLEGMKNAKRRWARHRSYRNLKSFVLGSVTATEVTGGGRHGWHPHLHVIMILDGEHDLFGLRDAWLTSLRAEGLDGTGDGWDVRDAGVAGLYIAKWGAAEELTLKDQKNSRGSGRTPAELLAASCDDGDQRAGRLWTEYATVFHGRRQLVWSRDLKKMVGIGEVDDQEAATDTRQDGQVETGRVNIPHNVWSQSVASRECDRRAELLDRAEEVGAERAVEELTRGELPDGEVIEDDLHVYHPRSGGVVERVLDECSGCGMAGSIKIGVDRSRSVARRGPPRIFIDADRALLF